MKSKVSKVLNRVTDDKKNLHVIPGSIQKELLKSDLRDNSYNRLSTSGVKANRKAFTQNKKNKLINEWEKETNKKWPTETYTNRHGIVETRKYDAHHIIENKVGGKHEWWNITPAKNGSQHQGGIHRKGGPAEQLFGR